MRIFFLAVLAALLSGCAECSLVRTTRCGTTALLFDNGLLSFEVMPQANGVLSALRSVPEDRTLLAPAEYEEEVIDLMPLRSRVSSNGARAMFWKYGDAKVSSAMGIRKIVSTPELLRAELREHFYRGEAMDLDEVITLRRGESRYLLQVRAVSREKQPHPFSLWYNTVPRLGPEEDKLPILVPVSDRQGHLQGKGLMSFKRPGVFAETLPGERNIFLGAARPWAAAADPAKPGVLAFRISGKNAEPILLYTHKSSGLHTCEFITSPVTVGQGGEAKWLVEGMYFQKLHGLRDIRSCIGIDLRNGTLELASCAPFDGADLLIQGLGNYYIPALKPGELYRIKLPEGLQEPLKMRFLEEDFKLPLAVSAAERR